MRLGFCSCCSNQERNQILQGKLCCIGVWSSDGCCSSWVEPFMDGYTLHEWTHNTDNTDKLCALINNVYTWTLLILDFHFHSLFLSILNQDLFVIAIECFSLQWELKWIAKDIIEETNLDEFLPSARLLESTSTAAACSSCSSHCSHLTRLADVCWYGRKSSGQDFWFICFHTGSIFCLPSHSLRQSEWQVPHGDSFTLGAAVMEFLWAI